MKLQNFKKENIFWSVTFNIKRQYTLSQEINLEMPFLSISSTVISMSTFESIHLVVTNAENSRTKINGRNLNLSPNNNNKKKISFVISVSSLLNHPYNLGKYLFSLSSTITWTTKYTSWSAEFRVFKFPYPQEVKSYNYFQKNWNTSLKQLHL